MNDFWNVIAEFLKNFGTSVLESVALLLFGIIVIKLVARLLRAILKRTKVEGAAGSFVISIVQAALALILFFLIMDIFDIDTSSIITILAASGLAVGLALQDGLSNLASGVTILLTRPFKGKRPCKNKRCRGHNKKNPPHHHRNTYLRQCKHTYTKQKGGVLRNYKLHQPPPHAGWISSFTLPSSPTPTQLRRRFGSL